jgi:peptide/nickel transport system ATP-binding protein
MTPVYEVRDLVVDLFTQRAAVRPVDGVSYAIGAGESLAFVGESGSGKTVMNFAPLGLMPPGVTVDLSGSVRHSGEELIGKSDADLAKLRGKTISVIFQDPMSALNPARRIGRQIAEVCEHHLGMTRRQAEARTLDLLKLVGVSDPEARMAQYPHELSGGLCQRVMIAVAVAAEPKLLIADEPTTALDVTVQAQILDLLKDLRRRLNMAMVLITHDIGVVAGSADRVAVMYAGRLAEAGTVEEVLTAPRHPYTKALLSAIPRPSDAVGAPFRGLPGMPPMLSGPMRCCAFAPRCTEAFDVCDKKRPAMRAVGGGTAVAACHALSAVRKEVA